MAYPWPITSSSAGTAGTASGPRKDGISGDDLGSGPQGSGPPHAGRQPRGPPEGTAEVGRRGEAEVFCDGADGRVRIRQESAGALQALPHAELLRGHARLRPEAAAEPSLAHPQFLHQAGQSAGRPSSLRQAPLGLLHEPRPGARRETPGSQFQTSQQVGQGPGHETSRLWRAVAREFYQTGHQPQQPLIEPRPEHPGQGREEARLEPAGHLPAPEIHLVDAAAPRWIRQEPVARPGCGQDDLTRLQAHAAAPARREGGTAPHHEQEAPAGHRLSERLTGRGQGRHVQAPGLVLGGWRHPP